MPRPANDSVAVEVRVTEELDAARRAEVIELCIAAHESELFRELFTHIPSGGRHFLASHDGALVSHAVVTTRWAQPEGQRILKTAFVDAVSTRPDCERRGFGSATMRTLAANIDDYEIGCLQTDEMEVFYERLGWERWEGPLAGRTDRGLHPTPEQRGVMVLRLPSTPPLDLSALLTIEQQSYRIWD
jgi:GNAT superfamily N-acetyltransferase